MWFRRKPRNRRLGRDFVLDVKLRSSQVRAARLRMAAVTLGIVFTTVLTVYVVWRTGQWVLNQLVYENKAFAITELDVQTDGVIALDQLRRWTGVRSGQNLLALDLARVKRDLELVSVIQSASIERILPHTLRIRVVEREPLAQVNVPRPAPDGRIEKVPLYVDPEGWVMLPLDPVQRAPGTSQAGELLPVISVPNGAEVQPGRRMASPQVQAALRLLAVFERSSLQGYVDLKRIDVSAPDVLLVTTGQGSEITFGLSDLERQVRRWQRIFEEGQKVNRAIATLDLAVTNSIPARWLEASIAPSMNPKAPKPVRIRKKHV
jgi:cell division septal protein FtsQ